LKERCNSIILTSQSGLLKFAQQVSTFGFLVSCPTDLADSVVASRSDGWLDNICKEDDELVEIPKEKLIAANLAYARELEQIV